MRQLNLLTGFLFAVVASVAWSDGNYPANFSNDFYPVVASRDSPTCGNHPICRFVGSFGTGRKGWPTGLDSAPEYRRNDETGVKPRSYYGGYAGNPIAPALYPAIDTVSILASLAFLAFLLHSFASLFDRSRSILPSIVSSRQASASRDIPDPLKLILRALDEYDILSNNVTSGNEKSVLDG